MKVLEFLQVISDYDLPIALLMAVMAVLGNIIAHGCATSFKECDKDRRTFMGCLLFLLACLGTCLLIFASIYILFNCVIVLGFMGFVADWIGTDTEAVRILIGKLLRSICACIISIAGIVISLIVGNRLKKR